MGAIRAYWLAVFATVLAISATAGALSAKPQGAAAAPAADSHALVVKGTVKQKVRLTLADLKSMPRTKLSAKGHDGAMHEYEGVPLKTLLAKAGVPLAGDLRGQNMALYIVAEAGDSYRGILGGRVGR